MTRQSTLALALGGILITGPAYAEDYGTDNTRQADPNTPQQVEHQSQERANNRTDVLKQRAPSEFGMKHELRRSSDLIGMTVRDATGKAVGEVEEVMIHADNGRVAYVAIRYDQTLGFGGELAAAPPEALTTTEDGEAVRLAINNDQLKKAPRIQEGNWPAATDEQWCSNLYTAYNLQKSDRMMHKDKADKSAHKKHDKNAAHKDKSAKADTCGQTYRLSQLTDLTLHTQDAREAGEIQDVLIDTNAHRASFVIASYGSTAGIGGEQAVAPFTSIDFVRQDEGDGFKAAKLDATKAKLQANKVSDEEIQQLTSADRARRVFDSYGQTPYWETYGYENAPGHDGDRYHKDKKDIDRPNHQDTSNEHDAKK
ncbi:PRC-barrel domain containing protein [Planctomycetales bacterium ZRK34]|nr:PRC-barrel domain containing protein [Planctomycetales bacterium ZRK34]